MKWHRNSNKMKLRSFTKGFKISILLIIKHFNPLFYRYNREKVKIEKEEEKPVLL